MKKVLVLISMMLVVGSQSLLFASETDLQKENEELRARLERLEQQVQLLLSSQESIQQVPVTAELNDSDYERIATLVQEKRVAVDGKNPVWSNLDIQLYGYVKADVSYDTSDTYPGDYALWVNSEANQDDDNEFNLTAKQTRFGFKIKGPEDENLKTSGLFEFDFYGSGGSDNKFEPCVRHAYMKFDWPADQFSIIAGQTWDVHTPLNPSTLNYTVMWCAGNYGYRRPQIRLTKAWDCGDNKLTLAGAIARTVGTTEISGDNGEDAGFPSYQARAAYTFQGFGPKKTTIGFGGHWGKEEYDTSGAAYGTPNKKFDSWSLCLDVVQPINDWMTIKGELWQGLNMKSYLGGISQGVNTDTNKEISAKGGWVAASMKPYDKWTFNTGVGIDKADESDVKTDGTGRTRNMNIFGNAIYAINKNTSIGFEISHWETDYKDATDADNLRFQTSFIYKF